MSYFSNFASARESTLGTVYVVDDDEAVRDSIRWLLEASDYKVELYDSGESFITRFDQNQPAVILLDICMSGMSGLEVQEHLIARKSSAPIIFLTGYGNVPIATTALKKGAVDFLEKPFDTAALKQLIEKMLIEARSRLIDKENRTKAQQLLDKLTTREQQVLDRIIYGRLNKQIADDLDISIKTVEAHRSSIMDKTGAGTVADLLRIYVTAGNSLPYAVG